jgi:hypothetical protein
LKALAYFAVGVTSECSIGGRDVSYRLSFAGLMDPIGNSGYSFGTLQVDIGQNPDVVPRLLDAYQAWAKKQPDRATLELDRAAYHTLSSDAAGRAITSRARVNEHVAREQAPMRAPVL